MKVLNRAYLPMENLYMSSIIVEFPFERIIYNKALHINIKYQDKMINRVLIDNGLGLDDYPLTSWTQFNYDVEKMNQRKVNIGTFNDKKDAIIEVKLYL